MPTIVFVHGACVRDAPWWWSRMVAPLEARGIASAAVQLPSCVCTEDLAIPADVQRSRARD